MTSPFGSVDGMAFGNQTVTFSPVRGSRMVRIMVSSCEEVTVLARSCHDVTWRTRCSVEEHPQNRAQPASRSRRRRAEAERP